MNEPETLLAQALSAVNAGDYRTAADRFERAGRILVGVRPDDAVNALLSGAQLHLLDQEPSRAADLVARVRALAPGDVRGLRAHAEIVDVTGDATARADAWQAVADAGDTAQRSAALGRLGAQARAAGDHARVAALTETLLAELPAEAPASDRAELLLDLATARTAAHEIDIAATALDQAEALVPPGDDDPLVILRARLTGQRGLVALARGDHATALHLGEQARAAAVAMRDVMTYLGAASLIAMVHEQAEHLVDAYDTYVRARESLADLLGPEARGLVEPAIQLFEERLGAARFAEVWDAWVAHRRAPRD